VEVLRLIAQGHTQQRDAARLYLSVRHDRVTPGPHPAQDRSDDRADLVAYAQQHELL